MGFPRLRPSDTASATRHLSAGIEFRWRAAGVTMPKFFEGFTDRLKVPEGARNVQAFDDDLPGFGIRKLESAGPTAPGVSSAIVS
jgi:hypothetical protein